MIYKPQEDSFLLLKYIKDYANGKVLDLGTGSGVLAEEALKYTKDVLASDINKDAVEHCKKKGINAVKSDLFSNVKGKFDLIIFNPPYLPCDIRENKEIKRIITGGKKGYEIIERFLNEVKKYLTKNGKVLLVLSSLTNKEKIDKIIKKNSLISKLLDSERFFFEVLYIYLIY